MSAQRRLVLLAAVVASVAAAVAVAAHPVRFELPATYAYQNQLRCLSQYSNKDALVSGTYSVRKHSSDAGSTLSVSVSDTHGNRLHSNPNVVEPGTFVVTSPMHSDIQVCFANVLKEGVGLNDVYTVDVEVDIKTGYEAVDYEEVGRLENLKPTELELRKMESIIQSMATEREYLAEREEALRNTNESTFDRVKWFSVASMALLVVLGIYQVLHMRSFLKKKKAI